MTQVEEQLLRKCEVLGSIPVLTGERGREREREHPPDLTLEMLDKTALELYPEPL
jgi:hypothetical protein